MFVQKKQLVDSMQIGVTTQKNLSSTMKAQESGAGNAIGLVHDTRRHVTWFLRRQSIEGQKNTVKTFDALLLLGKNTEFQKSLPWKGPWLIKKT